MFPKSKLQAKTTLQAPRAAQRHIHVKCNSTCVCSVVMKSNREFENRAAIIVALRAGRSPKEIVDFLKLPKTTIYRVKKQFDEADSNKEGIATRKKHSRRSDRVRGEEFVKNVKEKIDGNPGKSMRAIAKEMDVGSMTIVRTIHEDLGLKSYALRKGQLLTENMKNNRKGKAAALLNNLKHDSFGMLRFFSDEKNFDVDQKVNPRNDRWICKDPSEIPVVMHTKFPASVLVLGIISSEGDVMPPHFFEKGLRMNADTYINVLETVVKPWMDMVAAGRKCPDLPLLEEDLNLLLENNQSVIAAGDWNSKHPLWGSRTSNNSGTVLHNFSEKENLDIVAPSSPTHYSPLGNPDFLDIAILRNIPWTSRIKTLDALSSDHLPVILELTCPKDEFTTRACRLTNWVHFQQDLISSTPPRVPLKTEANIDSAVTILNDKIYNSYSKNTVISSSSSKQNPSTKALIKEKNKARKRWQATWDPAHRAIYLNLQGKVNKALKSDSTENWNQFIHKIESSPKDFWRKTKPIRKKTERISSLVTNGKTLLTDKEIGNELAEHFSNQFSKEKEDQPNITYNHQQEKMLTMTTPNEVKEVIKYLANHKAPGHDNITPQMAKNLPIKWIVFLAGVFNAALHLCYYPKVWKHAIIIPIPKKSAKSPEDLRPISLLPTIGKIYERIILRRLQMYLDNSNFIIPQQFGFRRGHSTTHQLIAVLDYIQIRRSHKEVLQDYLNDIIKWCDEWKLDINPTKTQAILFPPRDNKKFKPQTNLTVNSSTISWADHAKYLGVTLDSKLKFSLHVQNTIRKAKIAKISLSSLLNFKIWGKYITPTDKKRIDAFMRICLRTTIGAPFNLSNKILKEDLNQPNLEEIYQDSATRLFSQFQKSSNPTIQEIVQNQDFSIMDPPDVLKDLPKVLQDSPEDLQDPPEVLQDPPELLQNPSDVLQELPEVIQVPPEILQDSPEVLQDPPDVLQDSPEVLQVFPEVIQDSPEVIQDSPEVIQGSPEVLQEVIQDPPDPRQSISSNAEDSAEQKSDPDLILADSGSIDRKETESSESSSDSDSCEWEPPREMITKEHKPDQENAPEFEWDSDFHQSSDDEEEIIAKKDSQKKKHLFMDLRDYYCTSKLPKVSKYEGPPVDTKDLEQIGKVSGNVDIIVKVLALRNKKQLNLDSWLFRIDGSSLGQIFDVWGKVEEPTYNIRFDAPEEIEALQLQLEEPIFYVPSNRELTKLIDLEAIQSVKGSDASWKNDVEIPPEMEEFSDDEKENEAKRKKKKKKLNTSQNVSEQHSSHYSQSRPSYRLGQYNQITRPRYSHHNSTPNQLSSRGHLSPKGHFGSSIRCCPLQGGSSTAATLRCPSRTSRSHPSPPEILQDSPEVLQDPPDVLQDSPEVLQVFPEVIQDSPEVIQVSPEVIQGSPEVLQEVIQDPPDPRQSISSNAEDSAEQKSDPDLILADSGSIDRKETESSESSSDSDSCEWEPPREMITKEHKPDQENAPEFEWDSDFNQSSDDEEEIIAKKDSQKKKHLFMDLRDYYCTSKLPKVSKYEGPPVDTKDLEQIGKVSGNVDIIVKVLALRNKKQLELDSWLFRIDGSSLGQIFDVWGKVEEPTDNIRFDAPEEIEALQLQLEEPIFYVPSNRELTKLIDLEAIQSVKGSDASWKNDVEIPPEMEEFSDDEKENEAKRKKKKKKPNTSQNVSEQHSSHYSQSRPSYRLGQYNQITRPRYSHHNSTPNRGVFFYLIFTQSYQDFSIMDPPDVLKDLPKVFQDSPEDLQDPPEVLQDPPELLQDPSDVLQELPEVIQVHPEILQDSPEVLQDPPDVLQDSPEVLQVFPEVIQDSPEVIQVSPEVIQGSPEVLQEVIQDPPDPRQSISSNAEDSAEQKSDPDLILADSGSIDRKETESSESSSDSDSCEWEPPREMITKEHKADQENAPEFEWDSDFHQSSDDEEEIIAKKDSQKKKHLFMDLRDYYCTSKLPKVSKYEGPPVDTKDLEQIGKVSGNVDIIVKVLALRNKKQLELDSWLFRIDGSSLGQIFDVWGKVEEPTYNIRFDAPEEIEALQLQLEEPIFYVPSNRELTKLIDLEAIQSVKGSDASWKNDVEIPPEMEEFSDDEKENEAKRKKKKKKPNTSQNVSEQHSSHYSQSRPSYRLGQYNQITTPRYSHHNSTPNQLSSRGHLSPKGHFGSSIRCCPLQGGSSTVATLRCCPLQGGSSTVATLR
ncbi:hypothetical protein LAZ67_10003973 [Cordylochernes scorpioides]|uniref:Endonuclease/exonuclease/phosphatase domain-containing protein n=1 Tax=Cordylochernes scorpioides TaxID=51811 RepID=A0ABY6L0Q7_9ARAC|nr:hypothetical protein LAZ67_10003973 [Cordylochernes scorpioides]